MPVPENCKIHDPVGAIYASVIDELPDAYGVWEKFYEQEIPEVSPNNTAVKKIKVYCFRRIS
jgi:hypothetical protein